MDPIEETGDEEVIPAATEGDSEDSDQAPEAGDVAAEGEGDETPAA